jgi:hypothetical protein
MVKLTLRSSGASFESISWNQVLFFGSSSASASWPCRQAQMIYGTLQSRLRRKGQFAKDVEKEAVDRAYRD